MRPERAAVGQSRRGGQETRGGGRAGSGRRGTPALFAVGLLALSKGGRARAAGGHSDVVVGGNPAGIVAAAFCFLVVLAAIGWGICEVYQIGHPAAK
jgi:hypothetical protein